jgi:BirA family biotin operon repressor/biotin-[acetyl-CoA-carboxylase] ligase
MRRVRLATCASTNDVAAAETGEVAVVADTQTGGRGRMGRSWHSPPRENLYVSLRLCPDLRPDQVPPITLLAGAVLAEVLAAEGAEPRLKWPNDLLLGSKKVAGILTEMASERDRVRHVVVGVGVNVNGTAFPPELAERATSLRLALGRTFDRDALLDAFLAAFEPAFARFVTDGIADTVARWRAHGHLGVRCQVDGLHGTALDLDDTGALLVRDDTGRVHRIVSGEVLQSAPT